MKRILKALFPARDDVWQRCAPPIWPRQTIDGGLTLGRGQVWRRWDGKRWLYQEDTETEEDWSNRQI